MSRRILSTWFCLIALLTLAGVAGAQGRAGIRIDGIETQDSPNLGVLVSVQDQNGIPITDLSKSAFEIVEDGRTSFPPDEVATQISPDAVVSIALVLDLSGSMAGEPLQQAKTASSELLAALLDAGGDEGRIAVFGLQRPVQPDDTTYDQDLEYPFGSDRAQAQTLIESLSIAENRPTPLYDALFRVVKLTSGQEGRRAIIVISDGIDKVSQLQADDPIDEANRQNIPIFPISLSTNEVDRDYLQRLAVRTGGVYREAPSPEEFSSLFRQVLDQLRLQYRLSYVTTLADGAGAHSMLVRVRSPQVQGFDEVKFSLAAPAAAGVITDTAALEEVIADVGEATGEVAAAAAVAETKAWTERLRDFVSDNPVPSALMGAALLLALLLLVLIVVWWRRRPGEPDAYAGFGDVLDPGNLGSRAVVLNLPPTEADAIGSTAGGRAPEQRTLPPGRSTAATATAGPPAFPGAPPPGPAHPSPIRAAPASGGTRVIDRGPQHIAVLVNTTSPAQRFDLLEVTDIGRSKESTIHLESTTVSRQHARIRVQDGVFLLHDLGSANGTTVNGEPVADPRPLQDGDVVAFGDVKFTFRQLS